MGKVIPFISVENAQEAIALYQDVFGATVQGEITMLDQVPGMEKSVYQGKIGHCSLQIGETILFINDVIEEYPLTPGDRIQMVYNFDDEKSLRVAFEKLSKQGKIIEELQKVFWGGLIGTIKDQFGVTWQIYFGH